MYCDLALASRQSIISSLLPSTPCSVTHAGKISFSIVSSACCITFSRRYIQVLDDPKKKAGRIGYSCLLGAGLNVVPSPHELTKQCLSNLREDHGLPLFRPDH